MNYKLIIAYDGAEYCGWQKQPNAMSIQQMMEETLSQFLQEPIRLTGSGRTDAGVHASGQVANFRIDHPIDTYRFIAAANGLLPKDIRVLKIEEVPEDFHSRFNAIRKEYHYHLYTGAVIPPFDRRTKWHVTKSINVHLLEKAASLFIGEHDFATFANVREGGKKENTVRTLDQLEVVINGEDITLIFAAKGFLYKMVRNITGTLIEVATGKRSIESIPGMLAAKDRKKGGRVAPPQGLFLMEVSYKGASSKEEK